MIRINHFLIFISLLLSSGLTAKNRQIDSMLRVLKTQIADDTFKVNNLINIGREHILISENKTALKYSQSAIDLADKIGFPSGSATALQHMGYTYDGLGDYLNAEKSYRKAYEISLEIGNKKDAASILNNIGTIFLSRSNYAKALDYIVRSMKLCEEISDKEGIARANINMGIVYKNQKLENKALECYKKAQILCEELKNTRGLAFVYSNIAVIYSGKEEYDKSTEFYKKALKIHEDQNNIFMVAFMNNNIGQNYFNQNKYNEAGEYLEKALTMRTKILDKKGIAESTAWKGMMHAELGNFAQAITDLKTAIQIAEEIQTPEILRQSHQQLAKLLYKKGNYREAYEHYVQFHEITDSIFNTENTQEISEIKTNYEVDKKEAELKAQADALEVISHEEKKRDRLVLLSVAGILLIVLVFSFFLYKRFKITSKQKEIIEIKNQETESQKNLIEEKQREIIGSITYAKRLQQAILPPDSAIQQHLPDSFLFYQPKDIVAGDFYWLHVNDFYIYIAAADCTGHGVPGAMVSVVCSNAINRAVNEFQIADTGKILDKTRDLVIGTFERSGENVMDGMDISLARISRSDNTVQWSGANNPLWYMKNGQFEEIKGDKQPVGVCDHPLPFQAHSINMQKGESFYLLTDGYADQFGGSKGKKFKSNQLKSLISSNMGKEMEFQRNALMNEFVNWKGNLEQIDDICILGIRL
ncbi:MAG: tetratricopeptide repeat protein [Bacteroidota bacterium]|nr:tetratricopeptide repeat protein [Bacteroidota bacterium]